MTLRTLAAAALVRLSSAVARAETLLFPSGRPVASTICPGMWEASQSDTGIEGFSPDDGISFSVDVATEKTSDKVVEEGIVFLERNGVTIDTDRLRKSSSTVNGLEMQVIGRDGRDEAGDASIVLACLESSPGKLLMITYRGPQGEEQTYEAEIDGIVNSIKPAA